MKVQSKIILLRNMRDHISCWLIVAILIMGIAPKVDAGMVPSEAIESPQVDRAADLEKLHTILENPMVKEEFLKLGLTKDDVKAKIDSLNDNRIHQLAQKAEDEELKIAAGAGWQTIGPDQPGSPRIYTPPSSYSGSGEDLTIKDLVVALALMVVGLVILLSVLPAL